MNDKLNILVVEDELLLKEAIVKKLTDQGVSVIGCVNGDEAFEALKTQNVDALWLDYYLRDTNGYEFLQKFNARPEYKHIPVIVVSNSSSAEKVRSMEQLGVKRFFLKAEHRLEEIVGVMIQLAEETRVNQS